MQTIFRRKEFLFKTKKYLFLFIILTLSLSTAYGQNSREELVKRYLNIGKYLIQTSNYDSAAKVLKSAFIKNAILPDELLYYYSFVLYKKGDLDQSLKLIEKYISISSPKAELFNQAVELKSSINTSIDLNSVVCEHCNGTGHHFHTCNACKGSGKQTCDVCKGKGKVLIGSTYGMRYGLCITCMGEGVRNCKVCGGEKEIIEPCTFCKGTGKIRKVLEAKK